MGRKRSIHSDISIDAKVSDLAVHGPLPLLLYTWAIPHADDWGRLLGEPKQFKLLVCPALDVSAAEIEEALNQIAEVGLWYRYQVDGKWYIAFPEDAWFKHQTYINANKRENDSKSKIPAPPKNAAKHQETTKNAAKDQKVAGNVPSPSPSPSPTPTPTPTKTKNKKDLSGESAAGLSAEFEEWWEGYPRKDAKKEAQAKYKATRRKGVNREDLFRARDVYARYVRSQGTEKQFMLLGKTFLGPNERWRDWLRGPPVSGRSAEPATAADFADERREIDELFGGDQRAWWQWRKAGKPEIGEWRRGRGHGSARNGEGDREKPG